jgi:hypothetical protein
MRLRLLGLMVLLSVAGKVHAYNYPIRIVYPVENQIISGLSGIRVDVSSGVQVSRVEFGMENGKVLGTDYSSPFYYSLDTAKLSDGFHLVSARAFNASGSEVEFRYTVVYVRTYGGSSTSCNVLTSEIRNYTGSSIGGGLWGRNLGSAGFSANASPVSSWQTLDAARSSSFGLTFALQDYGSRAVNVTCQAEVPAGTNGCPKAGLNAVVNVLGPGTPGGYPSCYIWVAK